MVHHDLWDYDNVAAPQLTTVQRNGKTIDVVAQAGKTGFLYVFDRVTGRTVVADRRAAGAGERNSGRASLADAAVSRQPRPPFAPQRLTVDDINPYILTADERETWKTRIANARNEGLFTPPALKDTVSIPGAQGGANWGCTAADPAKGIVYVLSINVPSIYKLSNDAPAPGGGGRAGGPAAIAQGRSLYDQKCQTVPRRGSERQRATTRRLRTSPRALGPEPLREVITGGGPGMPQYNDLSQAHLARSSHFSASPERRIRVARSWRRAGHPRRRPVDRSSHLAVLQPGGSSRQAAPVAWSARTIRQECKVPEVRMYTGYGMDNTIMKPPYSTLTAYDLNTGTIKWQVPAGGDDARAIAAGGEGYGVPQPANGHHHHVGRFAVPRRWRQQAARLRFGDTAVFCGPVRCRRGRAGFRRCTK